MKRTHLSETHKQNIRLSHLGKTRKPFTWHISAEDRFLSKVEKTATCWIWKGAKRGNGYGVFWFKKRDCPAHRAAYELFKTTIPTGLQLDHLCRNRLCVNPDHLEPVTQRENLLRGIGLPAINSKKTFCKNGHLFNEINTYQRRDRNHARECKECRRIVFNNHQNKRKGGCYENRYEQERV